ncbi:serine hydrolase [Rhabdonatronobacter sediminivivens]
MAIGSMAVMRGFACLAAFAISLFLASGVAYGAPYAAMVMDARDGRVIFARNHDTRLHPASLTKMMTLYIAFEAVKHGEISLDTPVRISSNAANTPCSCLGVRAGQSIALRYLIRAAALRSGNDAATAIAEAISGSEAAFAERMTRTARAMGMENTTFRNAHGLTAQGHLSTARDMTILGRQLYFDFPQYYNIFARRSDHAGIATVPNTNRRLLDAYRGADGIKTGYTRAAGFNLTASAERNGVRIIATMFGGSSGAARNAHVAELLDMGFARAQTRVATRAPATPAYQGGRAVASGQTQGTGDRPAPDRTVRLQTTVSSSPRPLPRPAAEPAEEMLLALQQSVGQAVSELASTAEPERTPVATEEGIALAELPVTPPVRPETLLAEAAPDTQETPAVDEDVQLALAAAAGFSTATAEDIAALEDDGRLSAPDQDHTDAIDSAIAMAGTSDEAHVEPVAASFAPAAAALRPEPRPADMASTDGPAPNAMIQLTSMNDDATDDRAQVAMVTEAAAAGGSEIVSRVSTSSGRVWGVSLGRFNSRHEAERILIQTALSEAVALENGLRRVRQQSGGFEASFAGLTRDEADMACRRMSARQRTCFMVAP